MMPRFLVLCLLIFIGKLHLSVAQTTYSDAITIEHGLSQGMIFDLCQTRDGFLWVATKDGLNRYDGYNFKVFSHNPFDPYSLAENTVTTLFEDSRGLLWVGLDSKGLSLYDRTRERFHHIALNFDRKDNTSSFNVIKICEAPDGSILLLRRCNDLIHIQIPENWKMQLPAEVELSRFVQMTQFSTEKFGLSGSPREVAPEVLEVVDSHTALVYSPKMAYRVELTNKRVVPVDSASDRQLHQSRDVWGVAEYNLFHFQRGVREALHYPSGWMFSSGIAQAIPGPAHWVAVNNKLWYVPQGHIPDFSKPDWQLDADITAVTTDRNGNIWIGTRGYGLRRINPRKQLFRKGAAGTSIWGVWRDARGRYYVKIINHVYPYDPVSGKTGDRFAFPAGPTRILDMLPEPDGSCWLLGRGEAENGSAELRWYDADHQTFKSYLFPADTVARRQHSGQGPAEQWIKHYFYSRLLKTADGRLWASGLNCRLARLSPQTGLFDLLDFSALFKTDAGTVRTFALAEDGNGTIWIGTQHGLVRCRNTTGSFAFELFTADPDNPRGINNNSIACLLPDPADPAGVLWIGTKGGGINRMDLRSGLVRHITIQEGLPDNVVYGILPGDSGQLWCSTNRGLAKISLSPPPSKGGGEGFHGGETLITAFTAAQGLQDNEFNTQAFFKAGNGELLFGGVNGLNRFFPREVLPDTLLPPVFVVGLRINHEAVGFRNAGGLLTKPLEFLQSLELSHEQNNLSFEFAVLDFTDPSKNRYRYRLVGADPDWVETGTTRFAFFTHLAPGRYTLLVQGSNGEGAWRDAAHPIAIHILPPWWRSTVAYIAYGLLALLIVWGGYRFQLNRVKEREQLAFEHREIKRVKALEQLKTNFFSNVTHEFRTPLTLMIEPLRKILPKIQDPEVKENVLLAEKNTQHLLGLVNQLLDLAKLESGKMALDLRRADPLELVRSAYGRFLPLADQRGVRMSLRVPETLPEFTCDIGKVELVLNNLLSNALKFTPAGGEVQVSVRENPGSGNSGPCIAIAVSDTGIGIPPEEKERIFDRFYQVDGSHTRSGEGTGIGLSLSKELAGLMGGGIEVESVPGQGSVFTLWLPLTTQVPPSGKVLTTRATATLPPEMEVYAEPADAPPAGIFVRTANAELPLVLIVEDNADMRGFIRRSIGPEWQVAEASDGEEGVKKAVELLPDLIVSDLMMPRKDGYAVCDELKNHELTAHIPIILLTAKSGIESKLGALRRGADDYLTKPFSTEELLARMENLVETRRRLREVFGKKAAALATSPTGNSGEASPKFFSEPDRDFLQKFMLLLEKHLAEEALGVENFAQKLHISRVQLHRKLKALTNRSATDFIRDYRLDRAYAMLQNREGRVGEIALRVGFGNEKYFSTAFKEKFGVSPSQI